MKNYIVPLSFLIGFLATICGMAIYSGKTVSDSTYIIVDKGKGVESHYDYTTKQLVVQSTYYLTCRNLKTDSLVVWKCEAEDYYSHKKDECFEHSNNFNGK